MIPLWDCASSQDILNHFSKTGSLLFDFNVPQGVLSCTNPNCHDEDDQLLLCKLYNDTLNSLTDASEVILSKVHNTFPKHIVHCWNDLVREPQT